MARKALLLTLVLVHLSSGANKKSWQPWLQALKTTSNNKNINEGGINDDGPIVRPMEEGASWSNLRLVRRNEKLFDDEAEWKVLDVVGGERDSHLLRVMRKFFDQHGNFVYKLDKAMDNKDNFDYLDYKEGFGPNDDMGEEEEICYYDT